MLRAAAAAELLLRRFNSPTGGSVNRCVERTQPTEVPELKFRTSSRCPVLTLKQALLLFHLLFFPPYSACFQPLTNPEQTYFFCVNIPNILKKCFNCHKTHVKGTILQHNTKNQTAAPFIWFYLLRSECGFFFQSHWKQKKLLLLKSGWLFSVHNPMICALCCGRQVAFIWLPLVYLYWLQWQTLKRWTNEKPFVPGIKCTVGKAETHLSYLGPWQLRHNDATKKWQLAQMSCAKYKTALKYFIVMNSWDFSYYNYSPSNTFAQWICVVEQKQQLIW